MVVCSTVAVATIVTGGTVAVAAATAGIRTGLAGFTAEALAGVVSAEMTAATSLTGGVIGCVSRLASAGAIVGTKKGSEEGEHQVKWLLLGASDDSDGNGITYDCWKPVIHDKSREPSKGKFLNEIISHPNILKTTVTTGDHPDLPKIVIENIWGEVFEIEYLLLHTTQNIVCHATQI